MNTDLTLQRRANRRQSKADLLREIETLRNQQELLVEEIRQLLACVALYRDLSERAIARDPLREKAGYGCAKRSFVRGGATRVLSQKPAESVLSSSLLNSGLIDFQGE